MRMWLKKLREDRRLSHQEIANILDIDIEYYEILESGNLPLNIPVLLAAKISNFFEIPISRLIIDEGEYKKSENASRRERHLNLVPQPSCKKAISAEGVS